MHFSIENKSSLSFLISQAYIEMKFESMDESIVYMDKTIKMPIVRETRFRVPSRPERKAGLWVDRVGSGRSGRVSAGRMRILGQYAVVSAETGGGTLVTLGGTHTVEAGDAFIVFPQHPAAYGPRTNWFTRWIVWNGPQAESLREVLDIDPQHPVFHNAATVVRHAFFALLKLMNLEDRAAILERQAVVLEMLSGLCRARRTASPVPCARPDFEEVVRYIRRNLHSRLSLDELAALARLSVPHFRRIFRQQAGRSPVEFIQSERLAHARALLARGFSIKEAAAQSGFCDQFYFMRVFRNITGQTAGQFMNSLPGRSGAANEKKCLAFRIEA